MGLAILRNLMIKKNPGAYRGKLTCPVCHSDNIRYIEEVCLGRSRYRCRKDGLAFQYDWSNSPNGTHPYAAYKKPYWQRVVERHMHAGRTRRLKKEN